ncbi:hypothetical protein [Paraflavitalea speifideaquila]|uniref:hypothetical protein n=1 Tax=Paraflavitalea speifideaquila TaxID=3076558 RepID=UPI0028E958E0|nr:hypothetical protein [Paraflavitalea speifideiaquila]
MKVNLTNIETMLNGMLNQTITREEASDWAIQARRMKDKGLLIYEPEEAESIIWDAIQFLETIDMQNSPGVYLYGEDDIKIYAQQIATSHNK